MEHTLDEIDRNILRIIQKDATLSLDALSDRVNLSRNACWRRIKHLEQAQVILGRVTLLDPKAMDLGLLVMVMIRTNEHTADWVRDFKTVIKTMPEVLGAYRMTGDLDYVLRVRVSNMADYDRFYQRLIVKVAIADISASFVMEEILETTELPTHQRYT